MTALVPLSGVAVVLVTSGAPWAVSRGRALRAAGAGVRECAAQHDLWVSLASFAVDVVVVADVASPIARESVVEALRLDDATREVPVVVLLGPGESPSEGLAAALGPGGVIPADGRDDAVVEAVASRARVPAPPDGLREELAAARAAAAATERRAAAVAHDVRALLGIVVGFAANLRDGLAGPLSDAQREHVGRILEAAEDAAALTRAPRDSGAPSAEPPQGARARRAPRVQLELGGLAAAVLRLVRAVAAERAISLSLEPRAPVHLFGDPLRLKQAILNLVLNALKFTPRGGRVTVQVGVARGGAGEGGGRAARAQAELVVTDTGPGVPREHAERIFEAGVRLCPEVPGSGVGLSVVKGIVDLHRGAVHVEPSPEGGARFVVRLPVDLRARAGGEEVAR